MSEAASAPVSDRPSKLVNELRVSGHLMALDAGLFCVFLTPSKAANAATGLPGIRVSLPPGPMGRPEAVSIASFRDDGWLGGFGDAALVRVAGGPAQVLVTIYQAPDLADSAPNVQVLRLSDAPAGGVPRPSAGGPAPMPGQAAPGQAQPAGRKVMDMIAHIQGRGDVGALLGDWLGEKGSKRWIEGFAVAPAQDVAAADIEYQAVLGRGWLSPWVEGGQFCGSRGMALPVLGLKLRLRGAAAEKFVCSYSATFVDGTEIGPMQGGEACEAESLAALESFRVEILPRHPAADRAPVVGAPAVVEPHAPTRAAKPATARMRAAKPAPAPAQAAKPAARPAPAAVAKPAKPAAPKPAPRRR